MHADLRHNQFFDEFGAMAIKNSATTYGWPAQLLHWVVVVLVISQYVLANMAESADSRMDTFILFARHKSIGITIFVLAIIRLVWRFLNEQPALPPGMPSWQQNLAKTTHWLLYSLIILMPITGLLGSAASNFPVTWFGLFTVPAFIAPDEALAELLHDFHGLLAGCVALLASLHLLAALKHHFFNRDDVLRRMLWRPR